MESRADSKRVRIEMESRASYRIMWLAGVRQLDLSQHCLKTFAECDRYNVNPNRRTQTLHLPAETPPAAWYLCALPIPWDWARNAHLAFEYAPGATWEGDALVGGLRVRLTNAVPVTGGESTAFRRTRPGGCRTGTAPAGTGSSPGGSAHTATCPMPRPLRGVKRPTDHNS